MKKIFTFLILVFILDHSVGAQTEKGTWLLGGSASFIKSKGSGTLSIIPTVGYFLVNHVAGGAQVNIIANKNTLFSIGPFGRYYFFGDDRGRFYASAGLNIGGGSGSKFDTGYSLGAGYAMFLNESIAIDLGTNYSKVGANNGVFTIGAGFQIHFLRLRD